MLKKMSNAEQVKSIVLEGYGGYDKIKVCNSIGF